LHAHHEAVAFPAHGLDEAVGFAHGFGDQPLSQPLDRLVVDGIHARGDEARVEAREPRARQHAHLVEGLVVLRLVAVVAAARALRGDVLVERAAEGDVDELVAAADAEHGLALRDELVEELDLVLVANLVAGP
jgi:hypothetical protein